MVISPCTWNMTAAQLVTPTTSQLATVNAIQAAVTASVNWTVNATGTSTAGYKWIEIKPSNVNSLYKDYRIFICERVNYSTNRNVYGGGTAATFNSASFVYIHFVPDGGAPGVTFTPANIETASVIYVGSKYLGSSNWPNWYTLTTAWTAVWLYECDGAMWIINRRSATSHQFLALGHVVGYSRAIFKDFNSGGTEVGPPTVIAKDNIPIGTLTTLLNGSGTHQFWYDTNNSGTKTSFVTNSPTFNSVGSPSSSATAAQWYDPTTALSAVFPPIQYGIGAGNGPLIFRGMYWTTNMKTRTTIKDAAGTTTLGYTWYPDDSVAPALMLFAFMNTP